MTNTHVLPVCVRERHQEREGQRGVQGRRERETPRNRGSERHVYRERDTDTDTDTV